MRFLVVAVACILVACGRNAAAPPPLTPLPVRLARVGLVDAPSVIETTGTVGWRREVQLGFTSPGRVARVAVNAGDRVAAG